jgi:hypothetical protein
MKNTIQLFVLIVGILLSGCKIYKEGYSDVYDNFNAYTDEGGYCHIFKPPFCVDYKVNHYNPKRCMNIVFGFSPKEYRELKKLYIKIGRFGKYSRFRSKRKDNPCNSISVALDNNKRELVNTEMYGFYYVWGYGNAPHFYFLRTENGLYFSYCKDGIDYYINALNDSKLIDESLKQEIINNIETLCQSKNGLMWYEGGRWY